tara:strand:+ start:2677 stop:3540 length:864 start_codon:yes stop_codon:yes gene_type:complete
MNYSLKPTETFIESWREITISEIKLLELFVTEQELMMDKFIHNAENHEKIIRHEIKDLSEQDLINYRYYHADFELADYNLEFINSRFYPQLFRSSSLIMFISLIERQLKTIISYYDTKYNDKKHFDKNDNFRFKGNNEGFFNNVQKHLENIKDDKFKGTLKATFKELNTLYKIRNKIVHSYGELTVLSHSEQGKDDKLKEKGDKDIMDYLKNNNKYIKLIGNKDISQYEKCVGENDWSEQDRLIYFEESFLFYKVYKTSYDFISLLAEEIKATIRTNNYLKNNKIKD